MIKLGAVVVLILTALTPLQALPRDCALLASKGYKLIAPYTFWVKIIGLTLTDVKSKKPHAHVVLAWKITPASRVFIYDENGTIVLETHSTDLGDIVKELNNDWPDVRVSEASFVQ